MLHALRISVCLPAGRGSASLHAQIEGAFSILHHRSSAALPTLCSHEGYYFGREVAADSEEAKLPLHGPNQWLSEVSLL